MNVYDARQTRLFFFPATQCVAKRSLAIYRAGIFAFPALIMSLLHPVLALAPCACVSRLSRLSRLSTPRVELFPAHITRNKIVARGRGNQKTKRRRHIFFFQREKRQHSMSSFDTNESHRRTGPSKHHSFGIPRISGNSGMQKARLLQSHTAANAL